MHAEFDLNVHNGLPIPDDRLHLVDSLQLTGRFECSQMKTVIKKMCNAEIDGKRYGGRLTELDLSGTSIMSYSYKSEWYLENDFFADCITLKKLILPYELCVSGSSFSGCIGMENICVHVTLNKEKKIHDKDGVLFNNGQDLIKYPAGRPQTSFELYSACTYIREYAFQDAINLKELVMPTNVPKCHEKAFEGLNKNQITLKVPHESYGSYYLHNFWGQFRIVEID